MERHVRYVFDQTYTCLDFIIQYSNVNFLTKFLQLVILSLKYLDPFNSNVSLLLLRKHYSKKK